ncbi:MAG: hypothetical protein GF317_10275 [Candidatus Lokiarchaeota archaeon]|nr:hypothetical protein [Candidatus Lokiarchaeota archaeon]
MTQSTDKNLSNKSNTFIRKSVSNISPKDNKIAITGRIVNINNVNLELKSFKSILIDDGSGTVNCLITDGTIINNIDKLEVGRLIRILGHLEFYKEDNNTSYDFYGYIVQDMSKLDIELYKKVLEIRRKQ